MTPETPPRATPDAGPMATVARLRKPIAAGLTLLAFLTLLGAVYFVNRAWEARAIPAETAATAEAQPPPNPDTFRYGEFVLAALSLVMLAVALAAAGIPGLVAVDKPDEAGRLRDARRLVLSAGGLVGLVLMVAGAGFFVYHFSEVSTWLRTFKPPEGAYKPLVALLAFVCGAGLAFAAVQPARADERDDPLTRRLVYGVNVVLTSLLLLAALVVTNVIIGLKVPNAIDTTVTGVYSYELNPATREFVGKLDTPVTIYAVLSPEESGQVAADARRMLEAVRDVNPARVTLELLSPAINPERVAALKSRFPEFRALALSDLGLVVTAGAGEAQYVVIPERELGSQTPGGGRSFVGESKLLRELVFLGEGKVRPMVYVTTGHGELEIVPAQAPPGAAAPPSRRPASAVRQALEAVYFEVKPLAFDPAKPAVPADAQVVIVADPRAPLSADEAAALRDYLARPKPGKLLVLSGPTPGPGGKLMDSGLNPLLGEYGMTLSERFLATFPQSGLTVKDLIVAPVRGGGAVSDRLDDLIVLTNCRELILGKPNDPQLRLAPILATQPGLNTWLESDPNVNPQEAFRAFQRNPQLIAEKRLSRSSRIVAASAVAGTAPRVTVFASGDAFADGDRRAGANPDAELVAVAANALRERPPAADIAAKTYGVFKPSPGTDLVKTVVLPGLIAVLGTAALGLGVWMVRRR